jgi:hypothetical protein
MSQPDKEVLPLYLDGILMQALLQNPTDRGFILSAESQLLADLLTKEAIEFPQLNSYYRMMLHRIARYYDLSHFYNNKEKEKVVLKAKESERKTPVFTLRELVEPEVLAEEETKKGKTKKPDSERPPEEEPATAATVKKFKIMKRPSSKDSDDARSKSHLQDKPQKSVQEKEAEYERARTRLFADLPSDSEMEAQGPPENEDYYYKEEKEGDDDYFNYQYHVPYYPSYYYQQTQLQQQVSPPTITQPAAGIPQNAAKPKMMYSTELKDIPVPRHILILSIGKLTAALRDKHSLATRGYRDPIDGEEVTLVIFPNIELAQEVLKNGLGIF